MAQKNGGGAFLIPYFIMLLVEGLPIFLLELALGQRLRKGAIGAWQRISPWLGGVGIASGVVSLTVGLYYNTVIAWCLYYFGKVSLNFTWKKRVHDVFKRSWRARALLNIGKFRHFVCSYLFLSSSMSPQESQRVSVSLSKSQ